MSIRSKLIIYTFLSISLTLIIVWVSINKIITNLYDDNAHSELKRSYQIFQKKIDTINKNINGTAIQISNRKSIVALTNLVTRYQNKANYQPLIFDNDKKKVALYLLTKLTIQDSDKATIYSKDGELIAYAIKNNNIVAAGISSFENGKQIYLNHSNVNDNWVRTDLPKSIQRNHKELTSKNISFSHSDKVDYITRDNEFVIQKTKVISRILPNNQTAMLGLLQISKSLDTDFFKYATNQEATQISLLLNNKHLINPRDKKLPIDKLNITSTPNSSALLSEEPIITNKDFYLKPYNWPTMDSTSYLFVTLSRSDLITARQQTRSYLFYIFLVVATLIIVISSYWLNRLISKPLTNLIDQARLSKNGSYPCFSVSKSNDEINKLGKVLNNMVDLINNREKKLVKGTKRLKNAQRLAKIGDWELDFSTNIMVWSDEIYSILNYQSGECEPSHEAMFDRIHPDDLEYAQNEFTKALQENKPFNITHRIIINDNEIRHIRAYGETFYDSDNNPVNTIGTIQDITEQTNANEKIRRTQKMNALGKLTGGIAHDFNNMLGVILGYSELLETSKTISEKDKNYIHEIIHAAKRSNKLTSKLLSFSRKDTPALIPTNINNLLAEEKHMLEKTLTARISLSLELENNIWEILLDKDELEDAIINMSINAMHSMPSGGKLTLSTKNLHFSNRDLQGQGIDLVAGDYVVLSISDTGTGMSQDIINQMFEPFFSTKSDKGTGLGLSQVYGFVQRSNGAIHVYSEIDHGTKISVYFPRYINEQISNIEETDIQPVKEDLSGTSNILIVDDEVALRLLNEEVLSGNGYNVLTADSGKEALKILETEMVDLLLTDIIMPNMDGYELASIVSEKYPNIKIQILSGFSDEPLDELSNQLYLNRLEKPFPSELLLKRVKDIL